MQRLPLLIVPSLYIINHLPPFFAFVCMLTFFIFFIFLFKTHLPVTIYVVIYKCLHLISQIRIYKHRFNMGLLIYCISLFILYDSTALFYVSLYINIRFISYIYCTVTLYVHLHMIELWGSEIKTCSEKMAFMS